MRIAAAVLFAAALCIVHIHAESVGEAATAATEESVRGMNLKQLKSFLADRGLACEGCAEKRDFTELALENIDTPVLGAKAAEEPVAAPTEEAKHEGQGSDSDSSNNGNGDSDSDSGNDSDATAEKQPELPTTMPEDEEGQLDMLMQILQSSGPEGQKMTREEVKRMLREVPDLKEDTPSAGTYAEELENTKVIEEDLTNEEAGAKDTESEAKPKDEL